MGWRQREIGGVSERVAVFFCYSRYYKFVTLEYSKFVKE